MAGAAVEFRADDAEVQRALNDLAVAVGDLRPALKNIGEVLKRSTRDRFGRSIAPDGTAWAPLKPATLRRKARMGAPAAILVMRGYLARKIRYQLEGSDTVHVGTDRPYGAIHQFGGEIQRGARTQKIYNTIRGSGHDVTFKKGFARRKRANLEREVQVGAHVIRIPARPFLGISTEDRVAIVAELSEHLARTVALTAGGSDAG